tara:strand:- start:267 stop:1016 length:750 start_codon:yes stop_codon:yes gene_type:complete
VDTSQDGFLGGRLQLAQPKIGYRAGIDPVLLAAACPAKDGEHVLELGCGVGVASLCLAARVPGVRLHGVEILPDYAQLARGNAAQNSFEFDVQVGCVSARPTPFYDQSFHQVIMNPPYFREDSSSTPPEVGRASGRSEQVALSHWIETAAKRLRPRGYLTLIQRVERLPDILEGLSGRLGSISVQPLAPRDGRAPHLVLVRARKSGRAAFQLLTTQILHVGAAHVENCPDYAPEISAVLRDGAVFQWRG